MTFDFPGMKLNAVPTPGERLAEVLAELGAPVAVLQSRRGPRVDSHEVRPAGPTTVAKLKRVCPDVAARLTCPSTTMTVGADGRIYMDVARTDPEFPRLSQLSATRAPYELLMGVGLGGDEVKLDLRAAAQILVGATTGGGKSTLLRSMLQDLVRRHDPNSLRVVIGDPKGVEMEDFRGHPCVLDVVQDPRRMRDWVRSIQAHMIERYARMKADGLRSAYDANMPPIVLVVDEFTAFRFAEQTWHASAGTGVTNSMEGILDLLERGRAAGIHLILATQNPVVSAVPGRLKACMPTRVALRVATRVNSQVILDQSGAETLLGCGDALLSHNGVLTRFQAPLPDLKVLG